MTTRLLYIIIIFALIFSSCAICSQELWLNKSGSGKTESKIDFIDMAIMLRWFDEFFEGGHEQSA